MTELVKWTCAKCTTENTPDFTHCRKCGAHNPDLPEQERACPSCGFKSTKDCCPSCNSPMFLNL